MSRQKGTVLVTGANGGLGSAIVSRIISDPDLRIYHGIYTVRNTKSCSQLDTALRSTLGEQENIHSHEKISLDLSSLRSVREAATVINARVTDGVIPPIKAIILNAGYEESEKQHWTVDGLDMTFTVNYLGQWLLTLLLLQSMDRTTGRIVWISSWAQKQVPVRRPYH